MGILTNPRKIYRRSVDHRDEVFFTAFAPSVDLTDALEAVGAESWFDRCLRGGGSGSFSSSRCRFGCHSLLRKHELPKCSPSGSLRILKNPRKNYRRSVDHRDEVFFAAFAPSVEAVESEAFPAVDAGLGAICYWEISKRTDMNGLSVGIPIKFLSSPQNNYIPENKVKTVKQKG